MESKQIIGVILLILGIGVILYGMSVKNSIQYQLSSAFGSGNADVVVVMFGGGIAAILGLAFLLTGGKDKSK